MARTLTKKTKQETEKALLKARHDPTHALNTTENRKAKMAVIESLNGATVQGLLAPGPSSGTSYFHSSAVRAL